MDEETLEALDRTARPLRMKRSAVIREAVREWIRKHAVRRFEQDWITALQARPIDGSEADEWRDAQDWNDE